MCACVSHLQPPPHVWGQFFDGVGREQNGGQLPEPGAPPQLSWQLLIGQLHADGQVTHQRLSRKRHAGHADGV